MTMPVQKVIYRREQLYAEVWSDPATEVAKRYGISSNALGKICKRLNVPTPSRGYWTRRAHGKIDPTPSLPSLHGETKNELRVTRKGRRPDRERIADSRDIGRASMGAPIVVPDRLGQPHPLIAEALSLLAPAKLRNGLLACRDERCLDVAVSPAFLPRAARIMNTLILALEERGLPVEVTEVLHEHEPDRDGRSNVTRVLVGDEWIRFGLAERFRQHQPPLTIKPPRGLKGTELEFWLYWNRPRMTLVPSGRLVLSMKEPEVGVRVSWCDGRRRIETRLNEFVMQLFVVAEARKQSREADRSWREAFEVESQRSREQRERDEAEARRIAVLRDALSRWKEARDVRDLIDQMRLVHRDCVNAEWIEWAESFASRLELEVIAVGTGGVGQQALHATPQPYAHGYRTG